MEREETRTLNLRVDNPMLMGTVQSENVAVWPLDI